MATNITIKSKVVDLTKDKPTKEDLFFVDTNIWFWLTYTKVSSAAIAAMPYQTDFYPSYTSEAISERSALYSTGLNISELSHLIESSEFKIYNYLSRQPAVNKKQFRHNFDKERAEVCSEIEAACIQVLVLSEQIEINVDREKSEILLSDFSKYRIDGYDFLNLEAMRSKGINQIITDDGDFASIPGITLFTANKNLIATAKAQNMLINR